MTFVDPVYDRPQGECLRRHSSWGSGGTFISHKGSFVRGLLGRLDKVGVVTVDLPKDFEKRPLKVIKGSLGLLVQSTEIS